MARRNDPALDAAYAAALACLDAIGEMGAASPRCRARPATLGLPGAVGQAISDQVVNTARESFTRAFDSLHAPYAALKQHYDAARGSLIRQRAAQTQRAELVSACGSSGVFAVDVVLTRVQSILKLSEMLPEVYNWERKWERIVSDCALLYAKVPAKSEYDWGLIVKDLPRLRALVEQEYLDALGKAAGGRPWKPNPKTKRIIKALGHGVGVNDLCEKYGKSAGAIRTIRSRARKHGLLPSPAGET